MSINGIWTVSWGSKWIEVAWEPEQTVTWRRMQTVAGGLTKFAVLCLERAPLSKD